MLILTFFATVFLDFALCAEEILNQQWKSEIQTFQIPWPSGVMVDKVVDIEFGIFRIARLQHNAISLRPQWSEVGVVENVFSREECAHIIETAEIYASKHGWNQGRHIDYDVRPTKDLSVPDIFSKGELKFLHDRFEKIIWPRFGRAFNLDISKLKPSDLFVTKYDSNISMERFLGPHRDKSLWSFVIPLNDDFEGGGTYFFDSQTLWKPPLGDALFFSGNQLHGGSPINSGLRYILAGFCDYGEDTHEAFMESYLPQYDGYAAQFGIRTADIIVGVETCEKSCAVSESCSNDEVSRKMTLIDGETTDEEWVEAAQSCELLDHGKPTVLMVKRWIKGAPPSPSLL